MSLSIGIVGLPNVGKSTLFNALTRKEVSAENYPFCTIDPSVGVVIVPDERLDKLSLFSKSKKTISAIVEFVDIAGLVEGASKGEGLGNKFLANIREVDVILHLVRIFDIEDSSSTDQVHVYKNFDPLRDIKIIHMELILADIETVQNRLLKIERDVKKNDKITILAKEVYLKVLKNLEGEKMANTMKLCEEEKKIVKELHLLTVKPFVFGLNKKSGGQNIDENNPELFQSLVNEIDKMGAKFVLIDAKTEHELSSLEEREKNEMKEELEHKDDGINELIKTCYDLLNLITFFTTGEKETRAWTIKKGSVAPLAGSAIHNDFKNKFIRANIIEWDKLLEVGSFPDARSKGLLRTEGKEYVVKDGDVVEFMI